MASGVSRALCYVLLSAYRRLRSQTHIAVICCRHTFWDTGTQEALVPGKWLGQLGGPLDRWQHLESAATSDYMASIPDIHLAPSTPSNRPRVG